MKQIKVMESERLDFVPAEFVPRLMGLVLRRGPDRLVPDVISGI